MQAAKKLLYHQCCKNQFVVMHMVYVCPSVFLDNDERIYLMLAIITVFFVEMLSKDALNFDD